MFLQRNERVHFTDTVFSALLFWTICKDFEGRKGKAIPVQARRGSRRLRLPEFLDNLQMKVATLSALRTDNIYPQEIIPALIVLEAGSVP
jgi:hypothetical protein